MSETVRLSRPYACQSAAASREAGRAAAVRRRGQGGARRLSARRVGQLRVGGGEPARGCASRAAGGAVERVLISVSFTPRKHSICRDGVIGPSSGWGCDGLVPPSLDRREVRRWLTCELVRP